MYRENWMQLMKCIPLWNKNVSNEIKSQTAQCINIKKNNKTKRHEIILGSSTKYHEIILGLLFNDYNEKFSMFFEQMMNLKEWMKVMMVTL